MKLYVINDNSELVTYNKVKYEKKNIQVNCLKGF